MNAVGMLSTKKDQSEELGDCIQRIGRVLEWSLVMNQRCEWV